MQRSNLSVDIETYSSVNIRKSGLYRYVQSEDFEVLLFAYSLDGAPVRIVDLKSGDRIPDDVITALNNPRCIKHAYNAAFEWYCLSKLFGFTPDEMSGWLRQWRCTMLHGLYLGYPGGLAAVGDALGLAADKKKMGIGKALINYFCTPCTPTAANGRRTRNLPRHDPQRWALFKEYCMQDVCTEMAVEEKLSGFPVPDEIQREWALDMRINSYGVRLDTELVAGAITCAGKTAAALEEEAIRLTGLDNPKSVAQLRKWLEEETDEEVADLRKETVSGLLAGDLGQDKVRRVLELRQELGKTSITKYSAMENAICPDGRARGLIQFYGSHTGRWAGRLIQVQNLPRTYLDNLGLAREFTKSGSLDMLKLTFGNVPDTLSQLIRTAFIPSDGHRFVVADFSAIEARIIAWLAGESWRQEVFATHGRIYEASAAQMFRVPIEKIKKGNPEYALRAKGKVAELALGYQGSTVALISMGALKMGLTEDELPEIVSAWRAANPRIRDLWYSLGNAALSAVQECRPVGVNRLMLSRECDFARGTDFLVVQLPSGRELYYPQPTIQDNAFGRPAVHYYGNDGKSKKWSLQSTYGGKLAENIVQAIARDCLMAALIRLEAAGYKTVMHIHDEVVIDCPAEQADLDGICRLMSAPLPWASGLILNADGFVGDYYKKE